MGWASGGEYFDVVATALIKHEASDELKRAVLTPLMKVLRDGDWDTVDESMYAFRDDPVILSVLYEDGVEIEGSENESTIGYDTKADVWTLTCSAGDLSERRPPTSEGHDELVRTWAAHDAQRHGGDGTVAEWMLIVREAS